AELQHADRASSEPPPVPGAEPPSSGVARWLPQHLRQSGAETDPAPSAADSSAVGSAPVAAEQLAGPSDLARVEDMVEALAADISAHFEPSDARAQGRERDAEGA